MRRGEAGCKCRPYNEAQTYKLKTETRKRRLGISYRLNANVIHDNNITETKEYFRHQA